MAGLADRLQAGEVDDAVERVRSEQFVQRGIVQQVDLTEFQNILLCDSFHSFNTFRHRVVFVLDRVAAVVQADHLVVGVQQFDQSVTAHIASAAGHENQTTT